MSGFLPFDDARRELGLSETELRRLIEEGRVRASRDERLLLRKEDVDALRRARDDEELYVELPEEAARLEPSPELLASLPAAPAGGAWRRGWARMSAWLWADREVLRARLSGRQEREVPRASTDRAEAVLEGIRLGGVSRLYAGPLRSAGALGPSAGAWYALSKLLLVAGALAAAFLLPPPWGLGGDPGRFSARMATYPVLAWLLPDLLLWLQVRAYRKRVEADLPFWLDLHATLVEGGIGFDEALTRICAETSFLRKPIFSELREMQRRLLLGTPRATALKGMAGRLRVEGLDAVVGALIQGEQMGASVADTLRAQADMVRNKVWEEQQARAQKLPTKLLFPIAVGVLPSIFLVTVGPPVLKLLQFVERKIPSF
jgi:tight adherence protein C